MAGPIRNLISTIQERQPIRSAIRGLFGIDSFDEMAARDREQGNDISNPYPETGMAPGKYPVRQVAQMEPADENQPHKDKGIIESIFTPDPNIPRTKPQQAPMGAPPGLMERLAEIDASKLSAAEKHQMYADAFYRASVAASKEQQKQLAGIGQDYASRAMFESIRTDEAAAAQKLREENNALLASERQKEQAEFDRTSPLGRQKQVQDLLSNPAVSPETAAFQLANDARMSLKDGQVMNDQAFLQLQDSLTRQGYAFRAYDSLNSYLSGKSEAMLEGGHPMFEPMSQYYRSMAKQLGVNAASNALRVDLSQAAYKAFMENEASSPAEAMADATRWIEETTSNILGDMIPQKRKPAASLRPNPPDLPTAAPQQQSGGGSWWPTMDFSK